MNSTAHFQSNTRIQRSDRCQICFLLVASSLMLCNTFTALAAGIEKQRVAAASKDAASEITSTTGEWYTAYKQGEDELLHQRPAEAETSFRRALNLAAQSSPSSNEANKCRLKLADTLTMRNKTGEAIQIYQQQLAILTKKYGSNSKEVVPVLFSLGSIQESLGDHATAINYYQRALHINEKSFGNYSPAFAGNLQALGRANAKAGKKQEAAKNYKQAMSILMNEPGLQASGQLQSIMHDYSDLMQKDDDSDQSLIKDFKEEILNEGTSSSPRPGTTSDGNSPLINSAPGLGLNDFLAKFNAAQGSSASQIASVTAAPDAGANQQVSGQLSAWQAHSAGQTRELSDVQSNTNAKIQLRGLQQPWSDQTLSPAYSVVQNSISDRNRYGHGEDYYERMIAVDINSLGPHHPSVANDLTGLAQFYSDKQQYAKAKPLLERAYDIYLQTYGPDNLLTIDTTAALARAESNLGNTSRAIDLYRTALTHCQSSFGSNHLETARLLNELAYLYYHQGQLQDAQKLYVWAVASTEASTGKSSPSLAACLKDYAQVLRSLGQTSEALALESRADGILANRPNL